MNGANAQDRGRIAEAIEAFQDEAIELVDQLIARPGECVRITPLDDINSYSMAVLEVLDTKGCTVWQTSCRTDFWSVLNAISTHGRSVADKRAENVEPGFPTKLTWPVTMRTLISGFSYASHVFHILASVFGETICDKYDQVCSVGFIEKTTKVLIEFESAGCRYGDCVVSVREQVTVQLLGPSTDRKPR